MVDKDEYVERLAVISGYIGRAMVFLGMVCGSILLWTLVIKSLF